MLRKVKNLDPAQPIADHWFRYLSTNEFLRGGMDQEEIRKRTIARFEKCEHSRAQALEEGKSEEEAHEAAKAIWNGWAEGMLAERKALEDAGEWAAEPANIGQLKGKNAKTKDWIARASVDFSHCRFVMPGAEASATASLQEKSDSDKSTLIVIRRHVVDFSGYIFPCHASFDNTQFHASVFFDRTAFLCAAFFTSAQFRRLVRFRCPDFQSTAYFHSAQFFGTAGFDISHFKGAANFDGTQFHATAEFDGTEFHAPAHFADAEFSAPASFDDAQFFARANFNGVEFQALAGFDYAEFHDQASFDSAQFFGRAWFESAQFVERAGFDSVVFQGDANFEGVEFRALAWFDGARFKARAWFENVEFLSKVTFSRAEFHGAANFTDAKFDDTAWFESSTFKAATAFRNADFSTKQKPAHAYFTGVKVERAFEMTGAKFWKVPSFRQASFDEAPDLDNVFYPTPHFFGPGDLNEIVRYRHMRRIAIGGHNHEAEAMAFKGEIRAKRRILDLWHQPAFWFGVLYDTFSNFGRSVLRPLLAWGLLVTVFAAIYLGISADMNGRAPDYASLAPYGGTQSCLSAPVVADARVRAAQAQIAATTSASAESWSLALKNGFVFIDWDRAEAARRTYGCLFGLTSDGSNTYPVVPRAVSIWGLVQNVLSAVLIFLLLGVRNLLKLK